MHVQTAGSRCKLILFPFVVLVKEAHFIKFFKLHILIIDELITEKKTYGHKRYELSSDMGLFSEFDVQDYNVKKYFWFI